MMVPQYSILPVKIQHINSIIFSSMFMPQKKVKLSQSPLQQTKISHHLTTQLFNHHIFPSISPYITISSIPTKSLYQVYASNVKQISQTLLSTLNLKQKCSQKALTEDNEVEISSFPFNIKNKSVAREQPKDRKKAVQRGSSFLSKNEHQTLGNKRNTIKANNHQKLIFIGNKNQRNNFRISDNRNSKAFNRKDQSEYTSLSEDQEEKMLRQAKIFQEQYKEQEKTLKQPKKPVKKNKEFNNCKKNVQYTTDCSGRPIPIDKIPEISHHINVEVDVLDKVIIKSQAVQMIQIETENIKDGGKSIKKLKELPVDSGIFGKKVIQNLKMGNASELDEDFEMIAKVKDNKTKIPSKITMKTLEKIKNRTQPDHKKDLPSNHKPDKQNTNIPQFPTKKHIRKRTSLIHTTDFSKSNELKNSLKIINGITLGSVEGLSLLMKDQKNSNSFKKSSKHKSIHFSINE